MNPEPQTKDQEVNVEVQIIGLKDVYDKKTKKVAAGLEYRLENPEVTVVVRASVEITNVYVHVQRCARAAIRTHDTNDCASGCKAQTLSCKITVPESQTITNTAVTTLQESRENKKAKLQDTTIMTDDIVCNKLSQDLSHFNLDRKDDGLRKDPLEEERIILQPNTALERHLVASYYSHEPRIRYVVEQPELPALLKLVAKRSMLIGDRRKRPTRKKSTDENFWWACGHCFFERQKKSTIRAHLIQGVCREPRLQRHMSKRIHSLSELERRSELDKYRHDSWKRSLSI